MEDTEPRTHAWRIEEREYRRHQGRRGRRFAYPRLTPARTTLIVIDMVPFFVDANPYARGIADSVRRSSAAMVAC